MSIQPYPIERYEEKLVFFFESKNLHSGRSIIKVVTYAPVNRHGKTYVNLGFGDFDEAADDMVNDQVTSNNGDMRKVLATVVSTMDIFFSEHPDQAVHLTGSDNIRNEYYQKLVNDYDGLISNKYAVQGFKNSKFEDFQPQKQYEFLLIRMKKSSFT